MYLIILHSTLSSCFLTYVNLTNGNIFAISIIETIMKDKSSITLYDWLVFIYYANCGDRPKIVIM